MGSPKYKQIPKKASAQPDTSRKSSKNNGETAKDKVEIKLYIEKIKKMIGDKGGSKKAAQIIKDMIDSKS